MKEQMEINTTQDIKGWGSALTIMGIMHFFIPALDGAWGAILVIMGFLCLVIRHRSLYIMIGVGLIAIGFLNFSGGSFWSVYGALQIFWGIKELLKFGKSGEIEAEKAPEELLLSNEKPLAE